MGEVSDYIAELDEPARTLLDGYRQRTVELVPEVEEGRSYGMAALRSRGKPLISVVQTKAGYSVFPYSSTVVAAVVEAHGWSDSSKGGIRFSTTNPLPGAAYDALVLRRRDEIDAAAKK